MVFNCLFQAQIEFEFRLMEFENNSVQSYIDPKHIFCVCVEVFEFDTFSCLFFACGILLLFNAKKRRVISFGRALRKSSAKTEILQKKFASSK